MPVKRSRTNSMRNASATGSTSNRKSPQSLHSAPNPVPFVQPISRIERFRVSASGTISSTGGGNIEFSLPIDPGTSSEFSTQIGNLYEEFRIIGGLFTLVPTQALVTSSSSRSNSLALIVYDNALIYPPGAYGDLIAYANRDEFNTQSVVHRPYKYGWRVPSVGADTPVNWFPTSSPSVTSSLMIFASGLTPSLVYFTYINDIYIEVRTRS